jgi:hypothetical protein
MHSPLFHRTARLAVVGAAFAMIGCYSYQPVGALQPTDRIPSDVRVYRYTGTVVELATARIANDTIYGVLERGSGVETKIPLAHVDSILYRKVEPRKTAMFAVGAVALLVWSIQYIIANGPGPA